MKKYIIFDFDGTLVNSNDAVINSLRETYKFVFNKYPTDLSIKNILGKPLKTQIKSFGIEKSEILDEAMEYYKKYYRKIRDRDTREYKGIKEILDKLKEENIKMAILSNKGKNGLEHGLKKFSYEDYFSLVIGKDDVKNNKPDPEAFTYIHNFFGGKREEYIMVGDSLSDIKFGKNVEIETVLVSWTLIPNEQFLNTRPNYILDKPSDLLEIIKK